VATPLQVVACVSARRSPSSELVSDLLSCSCRVVADEVVKSSHISIDCFKERLLRLLQSALHPLFLGSKLPLNERLDVFFDCGGELLEIGPGFLQAVGHQPAYLLLESDKAFLLLRDLVQTLLLNFLGHRVRQVSEFALELGQLLLAKRRARSFVVLQSKCLVNEDLELVHFLAETGFVDVNGLDLVLELFQVFLGFLGDLKCGFRGLVCPHDLQLV